MRLPVAWLCLLGCSGFADSGLDAYVNRDLTKLSKAESAKFEARLHAIVKEKADPSAWQVPRPRWFKKYQVGTSEWLLLAYEQAMSIPGSGSVKVYGFTPDWRKTFVSEFSTGYRLTPTKVELIQPREFVQPVLSIHVQSLGPFVVQGKSRKPAFHPESGLVLYCTFNDQGGTLVRITLGDGKLTGNSFHGGFPSLGGPDVSIKPASAWKADLDSNDPVRQLAAIMWLSSHHLNSKGWRKQGFARESVESSRSYEELRADPAVTERLKELSKSTCAWVKEQSAQALEHIARPLAPVEDPPNWGGQARR